ncbi:MAG: hypothetical protein QW184_00265 [Nanopusillaceae archaeon]
MLDNYYLSIPLLNNLTVKLVKQLKSSILVEYPNFIYDTLLEFKGRVVIDNGEFLRFKFGIDLNEDEFIGFLKVITPKFYVFIPDKLFDAKTTKKLFDKFMKKVKYHLAIAVIQGKSKKEVVDLAKHYYKNDIERIAIPFKVRKHFYNNNIDITREILNNTKYSLEDVFWLGFNLEEIKNPNLKALLHVLSFDTHYPLAFALEFLEGRVKEEDFLVKDVSSEICYKYFFENVSILEENIKTIKYFINKFEDNILKYET